MRAQSYELGISQLRAAIIDIVSGFQAWRLWVALAMEDIRLRFKRTYIGIFWTTLSFILFVIVKVVIFSPFMTVDANYFTNYVAINYFAWMFISSQLTDGAHVFITSERWIKGGRMPMTLYVNVSMMRSLVLTLFNFLVILGMLIFYRVTPTWSTIWSVVVFFLFIINGYSVHYILGVICTRFRDVSHLIQAILRVMFFLTPIFWLPEQMGSLWTDYLIYNPFAHFLISFREPILTGTVPWDSLAIVAYCTIGLAALAFGLLVFARRKIVFWL